MLPELLLHHLTLHEEQLASQSPEPGRLWEQAGEGGKGMRERGGQLTFFMLQKVYPKSPFWSVTFPTGTTFCVHTAPSTEQLQD